MLRDGTEAGIYCHEGAKPEQNLETECQKIRTEKIVLKCENEQLAQQLEALRLDFGMLLAERELQQNVVESALELDAVGDDDGGGGVDDGGGGVVAQEAGKDGGGMVFVHGGTKTKTGVKKRCSVCHAHLYVSKLFRGRDESIRCTGCRG